jgi:hypothetical protein
MRSHTLALCLCLSLGAYGCASYTFSKGAVVSEVQLNSDLADCRGVAEKRTGSADSTAAINRCMEGKGYTVTKSGLAQYW